MIAATSYQIKDRNSHSFSSCLLSETLLKHGKYDAVQDCVCWGSNN